jgi:hypothetical protein
MYFVVHNSIFFAGTCRWGEYGRGGLLWGECNGRYFEWFEGDPVTELLFKVQAHFFLCSYYCLLFDYSYII